MSSTVNEDATITVEYFHNDGTTVCVVRVKNSANQARDFTGVARLHPNDKYDIDVGEVLSFSRAMQSVASEAKEVADYLVEQNSQPSFADALSEFLQGMTEVLFP